jgi:peptidoglycan/xylan/chitin deacetylase (PgdA/CDA1 family)
MFENVFKSLVEKDNKFYIFLLKALVHLLSPVHSINRITILNYHRVTKKPARFDEYSINSAEFDWQMRLLSKVFNVISIEQAASFLEGGEIPRRAVVMTFDDGYLDNLTQALPILKKYNVPATIYVAGDAIKTGRIWNEEVCHVVMQSNANELDCSELGLGLLPVKTEQEKKQTIEQLIVLLKNQRTEKRNAYLTLLYNISNTNEVARYMLSENDLRILAKEPIITIGCHTMNHPMLSYISTDAAKADITESLNYLKQLLGVSIEHFAYPYGKYGKDFHAEHVNTVAKLNFRSAVTTDWGSVKSTSSFYMMKRFTPWSNNLLHYFLSLCRNFQN